uniref:Translation initiation factor IF2/IF5 domain-containing protein n=1 Tax=viral metagenome TaxID=1070528 RepID=A0A6C0EBT6_9ZZZZ
MNDNYSFDSMVNESYQLLEVYSEDKLVLPKLETEINMSRLYWKNIMEYLKVLNRSPDHFYIFLKNELCNNEINWYSGNKDDGILIRGKNKKNTEIIELIKKYINKYVICSCCKKINTELNKITSKKYEFKCLCCEMTKCL